MVDYFSDFLRVAFEESHNLFSILVEYRGILVVAPG